MFQNGPGHRGLSKYDTTENQGKRKAILPVGASSLSTPVVAGDGTVYLMDDTQLYAIGPDGTQKWAFSTLTSSRADPTLGPDGTIYVAAGMIYAISPDGKKQWVTGGNSDDMPSSFFYTPIIGTGNILYALTNDRTIYAINPDGTERWHYKAAGTTILNDDDLIGVDQSDGVPALGLHDEIYYISSHPALISLRPDGAFKWKYSFDQRIVSSPTVGPDGKIYVCLEWSLMAFNPTGSPAWQFNVTDAIFTPAAVGPNNAIYFGAGDYLVSLSTKGQLNWRADLSMVAATEYDLQEALRQPTTTIIGETIAGHSASYDYFDCVDQARMEEWERQQGNQPRPASMTYKEWVTRRFDPPIAIGAEGTVHLYYDKSVVAVQQDGAAKWSYCVEGDAPDSEFRRGVHSGPVIGPNGVIFIGSEDGILHTIDRGIPMPPRDLHLTLGNRIVTLGWHPPCNDNGAPVERFEIYRTVDPPGARPLELLATVDGNSNSYTDEFPLWGQPLHYDVESVNSIGSSPRVDANTITDPAAPKVQIQRPADGRIIIGGVVRTDGIVEHGIGLSNVRVSLNGAIWASANGTTDWTKTFILASGKYTLYVEAVDILGRTGLDSVHFYVDSELPTLDIIDPQEYHRYTRSSAMMRGTATDDIGIGQVEVSLNNFVWEKVTFKTTSSWYYELHLTEGNTKIYVRATDLANQSVVKIVNIKMSLENTTQEKVDGSAFDPFSIILAIFIILVIIPIAQCIKVCSDIAMDEMGPDIKETPVHLVHTPKAYCSRPSLARPIENRQVTDVPDPISETISDDEVIWDPDP